MSICKPRLSRAKEAEHRDYLRKLQAEGVDVEIPEEWQEHLRALDIVVGGPTENMVFESATGGIHYAVLLRLVVERSGMILTGWDLSTDYDDQIVTESFDDRDRVWKLGGREYSQSEVLNSRIARNLILPRGRIIEGCLLATGLRRVPAHYSNFAAVPFRLNLWDQFGNEIGAEEGTLSVLRKAQQGNASVGKGSGLHGPDVTGERPEPSVGVASQRRYIELLDQEKLAQEQKVAGHNGAGVVEKRTEAEWAEEEQRVMKRLAEEMGRTRRDRTLRE
jgi:hypothetical protein